MHEKVVMAPGPFKMLLYELLKTQTTSVSSNVGSFHLEFIDFHIRLLTHQFCDNWQMGESFDGMDVNRGSLSKRR